MDSDAIAGYFWKFQGRSLCVRFFGLLELLSHSIYEHARCVASAHAAFAAHSRQLTSGCSIQQLSRIAEGSSEVQVFTFRSHTCRNWLR
jgi:hypothetical protein